jgi:copper chaperone NosL
MVPLTLAITLAAACSPIRPVAVHAGDVCFRCHRTITDTRIAAELVDENSRAYSFKTAGCLAKYLVENPGDDRIVFVTDYATGKMVRASSALFVRGVVDDRTGEVDFYAFRSRDAALAFADERKSSVVDWLVVMQQTRVSEAS